MILLFPDLAAFRLAVSGGAVPADVLASPATAASDADGRLYLDTPAKLPKKATEELKRLGVLGAKKLPGEPVPVACWAQVLPAEKAPAPPTVAATAPVLFDLPDAAHLAAFVSELLRLGNDRQSYRWLEAPDDAPPRPLLRVIGPPYYTLLRALDQPEDGGVRAYTEVAPRVWVRLGFQHPFAKGIQVAEGQFLFIDPPHDWRFVADAPFRDVYETLTFALPAAPHAWADAPVEHKLTVPLSLVPGNAADVPELWVLRGDGVDRLDAFVRDADERLAQRLKFAVGTDSTGNTVVVLRTVPSKLPPPVLPFDASEGFKPFWKMPNLYVPAGRRLHPTLRRDVVRKLLADDTDRLVWLAPGPDGSSGTFTPESLPEDSFAPLEDWVEYVVETNAAPLAAWIESATFDFDHFVCSENPPPKPKDDKGPKGPKKPGKDSDDTPLTPAAAPVAAKPAAGAKPAAPTAFALEAEARPPSEWLVRRAALQDRFLALDGPLDSPERRALWPELAAANTGYGDAAEAAVCWANAIWETPNSPKEWAAAWARTELPDAPHPLTAPEFDRRMKPADPTPVEARQFAAAFLALAHQSPPPSWLAPRLPAVHAYLAVADKKLSCRAAWLVAYRLAQLSGGDTLGLARARDRLLSRLLEDGLNAERDLPFFLRTAGMKDSEKVRLVRDKAQEVHRAARAWVQAGIKASTQPDNGFTVGYVDLLFAFAFARLGDETPARALVESAKGVLTAGKPDDAKGIASAFLFRAFAHRVEQVLDGQPATGRLDGAVAAEAERIQQAGKGQINNPHGLAAYIISRMREQSRVLEPQEKLDPYLEYQRFDNDPLRSALKTLHEERDPKALERKIRELYRTGGTGKPTPDGRFEVLFRGLPLAARVGEALTLELVALVPEAMAASETAPAGAIADLHKKQAGLLERALFLAAHYDRRDWIQKLSDQFVQIVRGKRDEQRYELINLVAGQCLRSLRKMDLRDEIDKLLKRLYDEVARGQTPAQLKAKLGAKPDSWGKALQTLLYIAGGWLGYGLGGQAVPILDEGRAELLAAGGPKLGQENARLAQAYASAVGHGPADAGLARIAELFRKSPPEKVVNSFTSAPFFSRSHLLVVEEVVLALVSDDFALGPAGRKWLEDDEFLIRRRVHRDMKRDLTAAGL